MGAVYVTTYEVVGAGLAKADVYYSRAQEARQTHWDWAESIGGSGIRPNHNGGLRSVFFSGDVPKGWRKIGSQQGKIEAVPNRGTKSGKEAEAAMAALPRIPRPDELASVFGYSPNELAMDGNRGVIYFPTELRVAHPAPRTFIRLPRFDRDGFTPDEAELRAIPESELMKAIEDHNAEAKRLREKESA
jgi:hypothetical protein